MMSLPNSIASLWKDPPPPLAFELSESGVAMARTGRTPEFDFRPLAPGVISVSPLRDNILEPADLASAVRSLAPPNAGRKRRDAALILPDACMRVAVLDFDGFPSDAKEQVSLIRFRMKKSIPYDIESAAMSYHAQQTNAKKYEVVVAVAPHEIIARYEAPFRSLAIEPGFVTTSALAALELVNENGVVIVAKLSGRMITILVLDSGVLKLIRSLELAEPGIAEIAADLYPTFVYVEDNLGARAERLLLCGFGRQAVEAQQRFERELNVPVQVVGSTGGGASENNLGLLGYLHSLAA
jgi:type IV pilus assembly protein PilM